MVRIRWLSEAKIDLKEIFDYISLDSKRYAKLQVNRIRKRTSILKSQPRVCKIVDEIEIPEIRELIQGNYRIIYRIVNDNLVHIIMVHHSARDLRRRIE